MRRRLITAGLLLAIIGATAPVRATDLSAQVYSYEQIVSTGRVGSASFTIFAIRFGGTAAFSDTSAPTATGAGQYSGIYACAVMSRMYWFDYGCGFIKASGYTLDEQASAGTLKFSFKSYVYKLKMSGSLKFTGTSATSVVPATRVQRFPESGVPRDAVVEGGVLRTRTGRTTGTINGGFMGSGKVKSGGLAGFTLANLVSASKEG